MWVRAWVWAGADVEIPRHGDSRGCAHVYVWVWVWVWVWAWVRVCVWVWVWVWVRVWTYLATETA